MKNKNERMLASFTEYCKSYPEQRFFQALRNWTRENLDADCNFIFIAPSEFLDTETFTAEQACDMLQDTFYWDDDKLG